MPQTFAAGARVRLHSLNSIVYNDMAASVLDFDAASSRYIVRLDGSGKELKVKDANMTCENRGCEQPPPAGEECPPSAAAAVAAGAAEEAAGAETSASDATFTCAICYEDYGQDRRAVLPCCGKKESSVQYCTRCIHIIIEHGVAGSIGRCPTCSGLISMKDGVICGGEHVARCRMCRQEKIIACSRSMFCELCLLGRSFSFRYECSGCHRVQRIPHPVSASEKVLCFTLPATERERKK